VYARDRGWGSALEPVTSSKDPSTAEEREVNFMLGTISTWCLGTTGQGDGRGGVNWNLDSRGS
jgi:hypothetical protein